MRIALLSSEPDVVFGDGHACPARLRGLAHALVRAGHTTSVICPACEPAPSGEAPGPSLRPLRMPASVREIDWHLSGTQPDVVIERFHPGSLEGALAAAEAGVPHLYDVERPPRTQGLATSSAVRGALPEALSLSRGAIVASEQGAERVRAIMGGDYPTEIVASAPDPAFLAPPAREEVERVARRLRLSGGQAGVAFFGPLERDCGVLPLVRALGQVGGAPRPRLLVIGDGPERNPALAAAEDAGVGLVLCGRPPSGERPAHLALCEIVAVAGGDVDGASAALLEAMAAGRAVLAPPTDSVRAVARHDHDAHLVAFEPTEPLAETVRELLANAARRQRLGAQACRTVTARHTWDLRCRQVEEMIERVRAGVGVTTRPASRSARGR